jgi:hypothetical protein
LQGGFATCIAALLNPEGSCILSSAGHPALFLNQRELELPGALPLGLDLALTRLAVGEESVTLLSAPILAGS